MHILGMVKDSLKSIDEENVIFWVKPHPTMSDTILKRRFYDSWPDKFIIVKGKSKDYLGKADILISGMSGICLESIVLGVPVIVVNHHHGFIYDVIPHEVPKHMWINCKSNEEIGAAINNFIGRSEEEKRKYKGIEEKIKSNYFSPVTKKGVLAFLDLN